VALQPAGRSLERRADIQEEEGVDRHSIVGGWHMDAVAVADHRCCTESGFLGS